MKGISRGKHTYPDGTTYEGELKDGKRHGYGKWTRPDGTSYVGEWIEDKPDGQGILTKTGGGMYSGEFKDGKRHGYGIWTRPDGTSYSGEWKEGNFVGEVPPVIKSEDKCEELQKNHEELKHKVAELESKKQEKKPRNITYESLKRFNFVMGFLHLFQGSLMLMFAVTVDQIKAFKTPVWSYFLEFDTTTMRLVTRPEQIAEVPFAICVSLFLFFSALAHFIIIMPKSSETYIRDLEKGINKFRWHEYAFSSSLMIVLIAMLFGVYDIGALIAIFVLNASMNWFGLLMERLNQYTDKVNWSPFYFGCIAGLAPWVIIIMHALGNANPAEVPWFVYAIIGSYFVFFNLFPINMILQYKKIGRWANYLYGERGYIVLSLLAKSVLAWLVYFGVMQPV